MVYPHRTAHKSIGC
jgi:hypothetical protein